MREVIPYGDHPEQFGELAQPSGHEHKPLVMLIHGGFWRHQYQRDLMHPLCDMLFDQGYATWNIEYRRVGETGGGYPTTLDDIATAIDHLATGPWSHTAVAGHSAGGHLALWNASRVTATVRPCLTIGLAPVADVIAANRTGVGRDATANFFGGDVDDVPDRYAHGQPDPQHFAGRVVLLHGDADDNVPVTQSLGLQEHVHRVEILEDVDHFDVIDPNHHSWTLVLDELQALSIE